MSAVPAGVAPTYAGTAEGTALPGYTVRVRRGDLIRYAGASGDFNVIHWSDRVATEVGLPGVVAHGMFTMGTAVRVVTDWVGDPGAVEDYAVRFTRPVPVPDDDVGSEIDISATVTDKLGGNRVRVAITATHAGATVLGRAIATVRLA